MNEASAARETALIRDTGLDARTVAGYVHDTGRFADWLHAQQDGATPVRPADLTAYDIKAYQDGLVRPPS